MANLIRASDGQELSGRRLRSQEDRARDKAHGVTAMGQHGHPMAELSGELDSEQRAAAAALSGPVCIIAGAGTGKTRTVTHRLAQAVSSGAVSASSALAITHSRKAAAELGERLHHLGVHGVDALTFHAAGLKVVRRHWDHTGRPEAGPTVLGEGDAWRTWRDALRTVTRSEAPPDLPTGSAGAGSTTTSSMSSSDIRPPVPGLGPARRPT